MSAAQHSQLAGAQSSCGKVIESKISTLAAGSVCNFNFFIAQGGDRVYCEII